MDTTLFFSLHHHHLYTSSCLSIGLISFSIFPFSLFLSFSFVFSLHSFLLQFVLFSSCFRNYLLFLLSFPVFFFPPFISSSLLFPFPVFVFFLPLAPLFPIPTSLIFSLLSSPLSHFLSSQFYITLGRSFFTFNLFTGKLCSIYSSLGCISSLPTT